MWWNVEEKVMFFLVGFSNDVVIRVNSDGEVKEVGCVGESFRSPLKFRNGVQCIEEFFEGRICRGWMVFIPYDKDVVDHATIV